MKPNKKPEQPDARRELMAEGVRSYLEAAIALRAFEDEVQRQSREIMEQFVTDYSLALKIEPPLTIDEIRVGIWPEAGKAGGDWRAVGAEIVRGNFAGKIGWWSVSCGLYWQLDEPKCWCWVGEWYSTSTFGRVLIQAFRPLCKNFDSYENKDAYVWEVVTPGEGNEFGNKLTALFRQWVELWKRTGGINRVFGD